MAKKKTKIIEVDTKTSDFIKRLDGFSFRFNTNVINNGTLQFQGRCISAIGTFVGNNVSDINRVSSNLFYLLGIPYTYTNTYGFSGSALCKVLTSDHFAIKDDKTLYRWLLMLEAVLNTQMQEQYRNITLAHSVAEALKLSGINAVLCEANNEYLFYPANAELLDQKLVVDVLNWLDSYPSAKEPYNTALRDFLKGDRSRQVIDNLRLCVELFFKQILHNNSSLENQLKGLGEYLKENGVTVEIRNMYVRLLDYFTKYNDEHIKHNDHTDNISTAGIEFLIYQTGLFLRYMIQLEAERTQIQ